MFDDLVRAISRWLGLLNPDRLSKPDRYAVAVLLAGLAAGGRMLLPGSPSTLPFVLFFPAVTFAAVFGGLGAGLLTTVLSILIVGGWLFPAGIEGLWSLAVFGVSGICLSLVIESMHRLHRRHVVALKALREASMAAEQARQKAEIANSAKNRFVALVSHELRTPLNAIIGFSEMINTEMLGPIEPQAYVGYAGDIHMAGCHLLEMVNDILDITAMEAGRFASVDQTFDPVEALNACVRLVRGRAEDNGVFLNTTLSDLPLLRGDPRRIKQVVLNLLSNAVKFTPNGGQVGLSAWCAPDGGIAILVSDTGIGMDSEMQQKAMEPFGQPDSVWARSHDGSGLGLPLARRLTELHQGQLTVDSQPGLGTRVTVHLPPERVLARA